MLLFGVMAVVLVVRPWGLMGRAEDAPRGAAHEPGPPYRPAERVHIVAAAVLMAALAVVPVAAGDYALQVLSEIFIFAIFAASLHFILGVGGMISFGHAAYLGLGAYGAALAVRHLDASMEAALVAAPLVAGLGALVFGWFCVRLSGVYLAMLSLAFAQIAWSVVFQWYDFTGGDNGILGVWPSAWAGGAAAYYYLTLALAVLAVVALRRVVFAPFGYALRAARDSPTRADAIGIDVRSVRWLGFGLAGTAAGLAGGLYAFLKGSVFPGVMSIPVSVDGLVMVLLGGVHSLVGPLIGAAALTGLKIQIASETDYWRVILGAVIIVLVLVFPRGLAGIARRQGGVP